MFFGSPYFTLFNISRIVFSLFVLGLLVIIPIAIYNLGTKLDRINQHLENIGNLLRGQQS
jgi:hypothetical protein